jgi:hypothetical protein
MRNSIIHCGPSLKTTIFAPQIDLRWSAAKPINNIQQTVALRLKRYKVELQVIAVLWQISKSDVSDIAFFFQWRTGKYIAIDARDEFHIYCYS